MLCSREALNPSSVATCWAHSELLASVAVAVDAQRRDGPCARLQWAPWQLLFFYFSGVLSMLTLQRLSTHTHTHTHSGLAFDFNLRE